MEPPRGQQAIEQAVRRLAELLEVSPDDVSRHYAPGHRIVDAVVRAGRFTFALNWKRSAGAAALSPVAAQLRYHLTRMHGSPIPLVAVPFLGATAREILERDNISWLDLSGNARIRAPGLYVHVDGQPNRFQRRGRPASAFAPKSARISRWLLLHPDASTTQRELAAVTGLSESLTSKVVSRLEQAGLLVREKRGAVLVRDPELLLDSWREVYDFSKHWLLSGHVPARSGEALLHRACAELEQSGTRYAATGLAAAWLMSRYASFRLATIYLLGSPSLPFLHSIGFRDQERGANLWLVAPNDEGVVDGSEYRDGVNCVSPVQAYLDLKAHPERSRDAADHLRRQLLRWGRSA